MHPRNIMTKLKRLYKAVEDARRGSETMANLDKRRVAEQLWAQAQKDYPQQAKDFLEGLPVRGGETVLEPPKTSTESVSAAAAVTTTHVVRNEPEDTRFNEDLGKHHPRFWIMPKGLYGGAYDIAEHAQASPMPYAQEETIEKSVISEADTDLIKTMFERAYEEGDEGETPMGDLDELPEWVKRYGRHLLKDDGYCICTAPYNIDKLIRFLNCLSQAARDGDKDVHAANLMRIYKGAGFRWQHGDGVKEAEGIFYPGRMILKIKPHDECDPRELKCYQPALVDFPRTASSPNPTSTASHEVQALLRDLVRCEQGRRIEKSTCEVAEGDMDLGVQNLVKPDAFALHRNSLVNDLENAARLLLATALKKTICEAVDVRKVQEKFEVVNVTLEKRFNGDDTVVHSPVNVKTRDGNGDPLLDKQDAKFYPLEECSFVVAINPDPRPRELIVYKGGHLGEKQFFEKKKWVEPNCRDKFVRLERGDGLVLHGSTPVKVRAVQNIQSSDVDAPVMIFVYLIPKSRLQQDKNVIDDANGSKTLVLHSNNKTSVRLNVPDYMESVAPTKKASPEAGSSRKRPLGSTDLGNARCAVLQHGKLKKVRRDEGKK
jgi:hypothetical protein